MTEDDDLMAELRVMAKPLEDDPALLASCLEGVDEGDEVDVDGDDGAWLHGEWTG